MTTTNSNPEASLKQVEWLLQEFFLWNMNQVRSTFDGDIDSALILGEIAHHNRLMKFGRSASADRGDGADPPMSPANIRGISRATGIPRETVRRKVQRLARQGWLRVGPEWQLFATPPANPEGERETLLRFLEVASTVCTSLREEAENDPELKRLLTRLDRAWPRDVTSVTSLSK